MSASIQKIPKPQLRGLLKSYLKKHVSIGILLGIASSISYKVFIADPRKKAYADFYKTYDAEEHYQAMKKAGVLPDFPTVD